MKRERSIGNIADNDGPDTAPACDLRFPGQYFDAWTGLHYNYLRDYDATAGNGGAAFYRFRY